MTPQMLTPEETGKIIFYAREIEMRLRALGAENAGGIHTATEELGTKLSPELTADLHYIASIRNKTVHGDGLLDPPLDFSEFSLRCDNVLFQLREMAGKLPEKQKKGKQARPVKKIGAETDGEFPGEFQDLNRALGIAGCIPVANILYFIVMLLRGIFPAGRAVMLMVFGAIGVILVVGGIQDGVQYLWWTGIGLLGLDYLGGIIAGELHRRERPETSRLLIYLPVLNVFFFLLLFARTADWLRLLAGVIPLVLCGIDIFLWWHEDGWYWRYALALAGAIWLIGLSLVWFWRRQYFPQNSHQSREIL